MALPYSPSGALDAFNYTSNETNASNYTCASPSPCRSTTQIVYGCLATVLGCVWVAVHPNIPFLADPSKGWHHKWLLVWAVNQAHAIGNTIVALLTPEVALAMSAAQWAYAHDIGAALEEASQNGAASAFAKEHRHWSITHAFFVMMGGFHAFEGDSPHHVLSLREVMDLVKEGALIAPLEDEIWALSKAGVFSKACALLQTVWFVVQCAARALQHLPLAQLEVATLAYTTMTISMYLFWWNKPLRVDRPFRVQLQNGSEKVGDSVLTPPASLHTFQDGRIALGKLGACRPRKPFVQESSTDVLSFTFTRWTGLAELSSNYTVSSPYLSLGNSSQNSFSSSEASLHDHTTLLPDETVLAVSSPADTASVESDTSSEMPSHETERFRSFLPMVAVGSVDYGMVPTFAELSYSLSLSVEVAFGGIHLLSLEAKFPSSRDRLIWRVSALVITIVPTMLLAPGLFVGLTVALAWMLPRRIAPRMTVEAIRQKAYVMLLALPGQLGFGDDAQGKAAVAAVVWAVVVGVPVLIWIAQCAYMVARFAILVMCFTTLAQLPEAAFRTVAWTTFFPHI
ncbi:hypothetical protein HWV62_20459 [Athelia sp. TMB]|nr:hypothetical protein HWV62_20459 [Athelia sp. TMB]